MNIGGYVDRWYRTLVINLEMGRAECNTPMMMVEGLSGTDPVAPTPGFGFEGRTVDSS